MAEFAPEMPVKSALVPIGAESVRRCSSVPPMREGAHFGAGLIHPGQDVPPLDAWIVELVAKVGASRKLSEADQLRLPTALQLQNQHAIVVQQAKAEAAAQKVAEQQSARDSETLKQLSAVKEESSSKIAALEAELAAVKRGKEEDVEPQFREFVERDAKNPFGGPGTVRGKRGPSGARSGLLGRGGQDGPHVGSKR